MLKSEQEAVDLFRAVFFGLFACRSYERNDQWESVRYTKWNEKIAHIVAEKILIDPVFRKEFWGELSADEVATWERLRQLKETIKEIDEWTKDIARMI